MTLGNFLRTPRRNWRTATGRFTAWKPRSSSSRPGIRRLTLARTLPCLLLLASCAVTPSAPSPESSCFIPRQQLQPTPVPPLQDETYGQVRQEADQDRSGLLSCNQDKASVLQLLEKQNLQRKASGTGSAP